MRKGLLFLIGLCIAWGTNAASFDCGKARTLVEQAICSNPVLSDLDEELGIIFNHAKEKVGNSEDFKIIAKGNLALRSHCKDEKCIEKWLRNSINLYTYLFVNLPADEMAGYPEEVRQACAGDQVATVEIVECANAKTQFHEVKIQKILDEILAMKISKAHKKSAQELLKKGREDTAYYCGIAADVPGTRARIISADCYLTWTKRLQDLLESQKETWEDELGTVDTTEASPD